MIGEPHLHYHLERVYYQGILIVNGERSSVGRAPGCGSGGRGFDPHRSPHSPSRKALRRSGHAVV